MRLPVVLGSIALALFLNICLPLSVYAKKRGFFSSEVPAVQNLFSASPLRADKRLQRSLTLEATGDSLSELLATLSGPDLRLQTDRDCAEQKVQIRLRKRPLHVIMAALAEWLPGTWIALPDNTGYRLEMTPNALRRRKVWWQVFLEERERGLAAQRQAALRAMRTEPTRHIPTSDPDSGRELVPEEKAMYEQKTQDQQFYHALPSTLQEQIAASMNETVFWGSGIGYGGIIQEARVSVAPSELPADAWEIIRSRAAGKLTPPPTQEDWDNARVEIGNGGFTLLASLVLPDGRSLGHCLQDVPVDGDAWLMLPFGDLSAVIQRLGRSAPRNWVTLQEYRQRRVWRNDVPRDYKPAGPPPFRHEALHWLGQVGDLDFVADYYSTLGQEDVLEADQPLKRPLKAELDRWAVELDTSWKQKAEGLYLFRHNRWYWQDGCEVPNSLLRRWLREQSQRILLREKPPKPIPAFSVQLKGVMDTLAKQLTILTPWQIAGGLRWYYQKSPDILVKTPQGVQKMKVNPDPFSADVHLLIRQYYTICFYASLDESLREALVEGRLDLAMMSAEQIQKATIALPRLNASLARSSRSMRLGLRPWFVGKELTPEEMFGRPIPARLEITSP